MRITVIKKSVAKQISDFPVCPWVVGVPPLQKG